MASPAPALTQLWGEIKAAYGDRVTFLGIMGDSRHCGPGTGQKSDHCRGLALDVGVGDDHALAWHLAELILQNHRTMYIIHDRRGRRAYWRGGSWFAASGHETHLHISVSATFRDDKGSWGISGEVRPAEGTSEQPKSDGWIPSPAYWDGVIREGMSSRIGGDGVQHVQGLLAQWGYPVGPTDGLAGPKFTESVRAFQSDAGISVDGQVGNETRGQLEDRHYGRGRWAAPAVPPFPGGLIRRGHKGEAVRQVQQRLADRGWSIDVDADFGPKTEKIVRQFQAEKGLSADGIVGMLTWDALWLAPVT